MSDTHFIFGARTAVQVPQGLDATLLRELWSCFCCRAGELELCAGEEGKIVIGDAPILPFSGTEEYTLNVTPTGVAILGRDKDCLMRGFSAFLIRIEMTDMDTTPVFRAACGEVRGVFSVARRMIHYCIFPHTTLASLRRLVRLCGVLSYTHVVLEFWGMLRFDCLKELSWDNAYSKEEIADIIREARGLGVEPIPMFNHLGHAAACRIDSGKHVVLDQNPSLQYLFTPEGWCWNIFSDKAKSLLRSIRRELYELFGEGSYFHIGCDEAHIYSSGYYDVNGVGEYLKELTAEVVAEGRRPILWGDMMIPLEFNSKSEADRAFAAKQAERMRPMLLSLHPKTIAADWHYDVTFSPVTTTLLFKKEGIDVIGCPWDNKANIDAHHRTTVDENTYGLMMTTWHTLNTGVQAILHCARRCGFPEAPWSSYAGHRRLEVAVLLRKLSPEGLSYADFGFHTTQITPICP